MEAKKLKDYFLGGSFGTCIAGIIISAISLFLFLIQFTLEFDFVIVSSIGIIFIIIGPILLVSTIKNTIKTHVLLSKLKHNNSVYDVYRSFSNTNENIYFNKEEIIVSDKYLFLKDNVFIIPHQEITKVYTKYIKNDKREITGVKVYCNTTKKKKIRIFSNIQTRYDLMHFVENIKQKNPNIEFKL